MPESKVRKAAAEKRKRSGATSTAEDVGEKSKSTASSASAGVSSSAANTASARSRESRIVKETGPKRRWLLPVTILLALLGLAWGALWFVDDKMIGFMDSLGNWNIAIAVAAVVIAVILFLALRPRRGTPYAPGSRRWVPPTFIGVGLLGVAWLVVYYVAGTDIPFMAALGNWNILIGMAGMAASFVIATLWK